MQIGVGIGEEADLEFLDQFADLLLVEQQRGDRDQGGVVGWNAVAEVDLGQRLGSEEGGDSVVDEIDRALQGRQSAREERDSQATEDG